LAKELSDGAAGLDATAVGYRVNGNHAASQVFSDSASKNRKFASRLLAILNA
jgi:hypothetical protein